MRLAAFTFTTLTVGSIFVFACVGDTATPPASTNPDSSTCAKQCSGVCASGTDPATGCGGAACDPCPTKAHQPATCQAGACALGACDKGYAGCNSAVPGCETATDTDPKNCGGCNIVCGATNTTTVACTSGQCAYTCSGNFAHCSKDPSSGCETDLGLDKLNCGACGHSCQGGACAAGTCQPLLVAGDPLKDTGLNAQYGITALNGFVYGTNWYGTTVPGGVVFKVPTDGSYSGKAPPWTISPNIKASGTGVFSNGKDFAYEIYREDFVGVSPGIWAYNTGTDKSVNIVKGLGSLNKCPQDPGSSIVSVAFDSTYVYWTNQQAPGAPANVNPCPGVFRASAIDGSGQQVFLQTDQFTALLADGGSVYLMDRTDGALHAALGASLGTTSTLATFTKGDSFVLAADATYIYVADQTAKKVYRTKKVGAGMPDDLSMKLTMPEACNAGFLVDDTRVYCASNTKIYSILKDGSSSAVTTMATIGNGDITYGPLTQDTTSLYWATAGAQGGAHSAIYKLAK